MLLIAEMGVTFFEDFAEGLLGRRFRIFGGYLMAIGVYLFLAFISKELELDEEYIFKYASFPDTL